jgi:AcrR family transcriptional regulator
MQSCQPVSPRPADPGVRAALIDAGARLIAAGGRDALTIRRLAAEIGTSTMAIYTHFGSMEELLREMRKEGFARLAGYAHRVRRTSDPVADVSALGWAYCFNAMANPHLYRVMFDEVGDDPEVAAAGLAAYEPLVSAVQRCIDKGRFTEAEPWSPAMQLWTIGHGVVTLHLSGLFDREVADAQFSAMGRTAFIGFGDDPEKAEHSIERAKRRMERTLPFESLVEQSATQPPSPA